MTLLTRKEKELLEELGNIIKNRLDELDKSVSNLKYKNLQLELEIEKLKNVKVQQVPFYLPNPNYPTPAPPVFSPPYVVTCETGIINAT